MIVDYIIYHWVIVVAVMEVGVEVLDVPIRGIEAYFMQTMDSSHQLNQRGIRGRFMSLYTSLTWSASG